MTKPHPWLPEKTAYGVSPQCSNCKHSETCQSSRAGWVCGSWEEEEQHQINLDEFIGESK